MCRSIKHFRLPDRPPMEQEIQEAALRYVRKVSGYRKPSEVNEEAFQRAVNETRPALSVRMHKLGEAKQSFR